MRDRSSAIYFVKSYMSMVFLKALSKIFSYIILQLLILFSHYPFTNDMIIAYLYCFMMYGLQCGFPSYADDLLLLSLLKRGMSYLMDICFANSISERCLYHYLKTNVMVAHETKPKYLEHTRTW